MRRDLKPVPNHRRLLVAFLTLLWGATSNRALPGENFTCSDPEIVSAAEQARLRSARFWSGEPLPGDWFFPCPITLVSHPHDEGGQTQFRFDRGEVSGWRMTITGTREALLNDVLPHEVDHMVRASLLRHPVERWLDEGCASLMESAESHARLRRRAADIPPHLYSERWLEQREYPSSPRELDQLYAGGFSLVEFLLTKGTPQTLLEFQRDRNSITSRLSRYYQLTPAALQSEWAAWQETNRGLDCVLKRCRLHTLPSPLTNRPQLIIWTADWCLPCQRFQEDYRTQAEFRSRLLQTFDVQMRNVDRSPAQARFQKISVLPTFQLPSGQRIEGYQGADDLLRRLGLTPPLPVMPETPLPAASLPHEIAEPEPPPTPLVPAPPFENPLLNGISVSWTLLQWAGVIGGSVATGGIGGMAVSTLLFLLRRRQTKQTGGTSSPDERSAAVLPAPFPRELDETRQLLALRQSEGRVAVLDALRGLFLDDELQKLEQSDNPQQVHLAHSLRETIDTRVAEVAPLTTAIKSQDFSDFQP